MLEDIGMSYTGCAQLTLDIRQWDLKFKEDKTKIFQSKIQFTEHLCRDTEVINQINQMDLLQITLQMLSSPIRITNKTNKMCRIHSKKTVLEQDQLKFVIKMEP